MIHNNMVKFIFCFIVLTMTGCIEENKSNKYLIINGKINALINNGRFDDALLLANECYLNYKDEQLNEYSASSIIELSDIVSINDESKSLALLQEALQIQNSIFGEASSESAYIHYLIGSTLHYSDSCIEHYKKAIEYTDIKNNGLTAIRSSLRLARKLRDYNKYHEAQVVYENALAKFHDLNKKYPQLQLEVMSNLANLYIETMNYEKASQIHKEIIKLVESKTLAEISYDTFEIYNNAASAENLAGNTDYAINLLHNINFKLSEMTDQEKTAKKITQLSHLSELYDKKGNFLESEKCRNDAYNLSLKNYSVLHPVSIDLFDSLINTFVSQNKYADAIEAINARIHLVKNVQGERHIYLVELYNVLGNIYKDIKKYEMALTNYKECVNIYNSNGINELNKNYADMLNNIADFYIYHDNKSEAYSIYNKLISIYQSLYGLDDWRIGKCLWNIAGASSNPSESIINYKRALEIYESNFGTDHPYLINLLSDYIEIAIKIDNKSLVNQLAMRKSSIVNKNHLQSL